MTPERAAELLRRYEKTDPCAVRLATLVSPAVRIGPGLLRRVRLALAPGVDAGAESDLWFSPLVGSRSALGIVLHEEVAHLLRARLRDGALPDGADLLRRSHDVIRAAHRDEPAAIRLEEDIIYLALRGGPRAEAEIDAALGPALRALVGERGVEVARWVDRAFGGLPAAARRLDSVRTLAVGAAARLGSHAPIHRRVASEGIPAAAWVLPHEPPGEARGLGVRLHPGAVELVDPASPAAAILAGVTDRFVEVIWEESGRERSAAALAAPGSRVHVPDGLEQLRIRTLSGPEYRLSVVRDEGPEPENAALWHERSRGMLLAVSYGPGFPVLPGLTVTSRTLLLAHPAAPEANTAIPAVRFAHRGDDVLARAGAYPFVLSGDIGDSLYFVRTEGQLPLFAAEEEPHPWTRPTDGAVCVACHIGAAPDAPPRWCSFTLGDIQPGRGLRLEPQDGLPPAGLRAFAGSPVLEAETGNLLGVCCTEMVQGELRSLLLTFADIDDALGLLSDEGGMIPDFKEFLQFIRGLQSKLVKEVIAQSEGANNRGGHIRQSYYGAALFLSRPEHERHLRTVRNASINELFEFPAGMLADWARFLRENQSLRSKKRGYAIKTLRNILAETEGGARDPKGGGGASGSIKRAFPLVASFLTRPAPSTEPARAWPPFDTPPTERSLSWTRENAE